VLQGKPPVEQNIVVEVSEEKENITQPEPVLGSTEYIEATIRDTFPEEPVIMVSISKCESGLMQFRKDGVVVKSPTDDYGVMQIHKPIWEKKSRELGLDIMTIDGNIKMARHIYEVQGLTAWTTYKNGCYKQFI